MREAKAYPLYRDRPTVLPLPIMHVIAPLKRKEIEDNWPLWKGFEDAGSCLAEMLSDLWVLQN